MLLVLWTDLDVQISLYMVLTKNVVYIAATYSQRGWNQGRLPFLNQKFQVLQARGPVWCDVGPIARLPTAPTMPAAVGDLAVSGQRSPLPTTKPTQTLKNYTGDPR